MNRQYKRLMQKQEAAKKGQRPQIKPPAAPTKKQRTSPRQFLREVVAEMRKVAWPTRPEVVAYSMVVLVSTVVLGALVFGMDYAFSKGVLALFGVHV